MSAVLDARHVASGYGPHRVLLDVSFTVGAGELVALVGSNGVGKTTLLKTICGALPLTGGELTVLGRDVRATRTYEWVTNGLVHVPEDRHIFGQMTVIENLRMGAFHREARHHVDENLERVYALFPVLAERSRQRASSLSGGEQQMLSIGRGVMGMPRLILLDEPSLGLSPKSTEIVYESISEIGRQGITVLIVEQNVARALDLAERILVMERGAIALQGTTDELRDDQRVIDAYLGLGAVHETATTDR